MSWLISLITGIVAALTKIFISESKKPKEVIFTGGDPDAIKAIDDDIANAADNS